MAHTNRRGVRQWKWALFGAAALTVACGSSVDRDARTAVSPGQLEKPLVVQQRSGDYDQGAEIDWGFQAPFAAGSGNTLTRSYVPPPEGAQPRETTNDDTTVNLSVLQDEHGSTAKSVYGLEAREEGALLQTDPFSGLDFLQQGVGGSGVAGVNPIDSEGPRDTVNPGRGSIPRVGGTAEFGPKTSFGAR